MSHNRASSTLRVDPFENRQRSHASRCKKSLPVQVVTLPGPACSNPAMGIPMKCLTTWLLLILPLGLPVGAAAQSISITLAPATGVASMPGGAGTFTGYPPDPCISLH